MTEIASIQSNNVFGDMIDRTSAFRYQQEWEPEGRQLALSHLV